MVSFLERGQLCEDREKGLTSQGEETQTGPTLPHLDLGLLSSRTVTEAVCIVEATGSEAFPLAARDFTPQVFL